MSRQSEQREYRKQLLEAGLCFECKEREPTRGMRCEPCAEANCARSRARYHGR
jgi:hypothetical protein